MKRSIAEDEIVVRFYFKHIHDWRKYINECFEIFSKAGFSSRKRSSIIMRFQNVAYIHTGKGLKNYAGQTKFVYDWIKKTINIKVI